MHYSIRLKLVAVDDDGKWDWVADTEFKALGKSTDYRPKERQPLQSAIDCLTQELAALDARGNGQ